jgi:hypothetical protein
LKKMTIRLGIAGALTALSFAGLAVPAQAAELMHATPPVGASVRAAATAGTTPALVEFPAVYGTMTVRETLTADPGLWSYRDQDIKKSVQWLRDGVRIPGATGLEYTLVGADFGKKISIRVVPSLDGRIFKTAMSFAWAKVAAASLSSATPTIAGTVQAGNVLTVKLGTWTWGTAFTYRWLRNGVPISGAWDSTYKVRSADKGTKITVRVTGSRLGYTTVSRTSGALIAR